MQRGLPGPSQAKLVLYKYHYERLFLGFLFIVNLILVHKLSFPIFSNPENENLLYSSCLIIYCHLQPSMILHLIILE